MTAENFKAIDTPLNTGINLIEASAGTGKTYTIAMLILRFVVEENFKIEQLLVVTFTKAATEELKDRIRARLAEAKQANKGITKNIDSTVITWLNLLSLDKNLIAQRLDTALLNIDQAAIFTIHGFCQRMLSEHALETGQLFNFELTGDIANVKQFCSDDFWRTQIYPRPLNHASLLTSTYKTPDDLLQSINNLFLHDTVIPKATNLDALLKEFDVLKAQALKVFPSLRQNLQQRFAEAKFKTSFIDEFDSLQKELFNWLTSEHASLPKRAALHCVSSNTLYNALNGQKFKKTQQQTSEERKQEYIQSLNLDCSSFDKLAELINQIAVTLRVNLSQYLVSGVDKRLQQLNLLSFDDLINRLAKALEEDKQALLTHALQQRFKVALIDEFQDTDHEQWEIFSKLFNHPEQFLYLIGDPKQAIYKFRGADIFSYFTAQQQTQRHFTLGHNWRSHPQLVDAVNVLFQRNNAFLFNKLSFHPVDAAKKNDEGFLENEQGNALPPLMLWQLDKQEKSSFWSTQNSTAPATEIQTAVVNEILQLLAPKKNAEKVYFNDGLKKRRLEPKDIAILVRSNRQAKEYQQTLNEVGVPAVLKSTESVFESPQAKDLYIILQAIAQTEDINALKQALSLDWFGLDGQQFYALMNDENRLNDYVARFSEYHRLWQQQGLMFMMQKLLQTEQVFQNLARLENTERLLTNLFHLIELLQQTSETLHLGSHKTIEYLAHSITHITENSEEQQLRLETDADAVKIVTMHSSKGLEYSVVFCPVLWRSNSFLTQEKELVKCHTDSGMISDLGSKDFEKHKQQAIEEQQAEDLRLLYVAVTRAKYRCYIAWADLRSKIKANDSALAYLMEFTDDDFEAQQQKLLNFKNNFPNTFDYRLLNVGEKITSFYQSSEISEKEFNAQYYRFKFDTNWQISSYTALSSLSLETLEEKPLDKAQEIEEIQLEESLALPKGSHVGNVIHSLLEYNSFEKLAEPEFDMTEQINKTCLRYGLKLEQPEIIKKLLQTVVTTPLSSEGNNFCLKNLKFWQCIKEMPFYLSIEALQVEHLNIYLAKDPTFKPLSKKQLAGFLTGFIDLICEYQGRYYVMDYKSNYLSDYQQNSLTLAMYEHNYGLQYWLYSVVLHLYLKQRLKNYDYQQHFGGVRYLFVRGMQIDKALSGVYSAMPDLETLETLSYFFNGNLNSNANEKV